MMHPVELFTEQHGNWQQYTQHLERVQMARHGLIRGEAIPQAIYLGVLEDNRVIGHLSLKVQALVVPATEWNHNKEESLLNAAGEALRETFVQTFAVEEAYRRRGMGTALQTAAIEATRASGCYQMRSWSSADRPANYALKLQMGFAVHPTTYALPDGRLISGVYFIWRV
ncbi:MAG: GNAT family N-acetyltransferase [Anaerolineae bacterium]|nr:GNAT family N-acetyltransferase [Anaerolineae bacterium]